MAREPLARRVGEILLRPVGGVVVALWVHSSDLPRRVPSLAAFTRSAGFAPLQSVAAAWADRNFELIEAGGPWLDRSGRWVSDHCDTGLDLQPFRFPPAPPSVTCRREVTSVYGFDGPLPGRLAELAAVLAAAGWGDRRDGGTVPMRDLEHRQLPVWPVDWSPAPALGLPAGLETMPPERRFPLTGWLRMGIGWSSRGEPPALVATRELARPGDPRTRTPTYQPVEVSGTGIDRLAARSLDRHEHAIAIRLEVTYYVNANVNARPGRLRKRLLPSRYRP